MLKGEPDVKCTAEPRCALLLFVIPNPDIMARGTERIPRDVEPAIAGQELVGQGVAL